jgi:hypothetical protein
VATEALIDLSRNLLDAACDVRSLLYLFDRSLEGGPAAVLAIFEAASKARFTTRLAQVLLAA